ncbi:MAG: MFS transporter [Actinobacteria bacterium]|nr:MFS transporter [Actinomycetota bacterium]
MTTAVAPLRYREFRSLWAATIFSATGTFIQTVAGSWLMFELTGSSTWVGLMVASSTLPFLFLSLLSGALADMFDRARLMVIAQSIMAGSALTMAVLTQLDLITPGILLGLGLVLGGGTTLNLPAWQALLPDLVPRPLLTSAIALQAAAFNTARAIGPALGGVIVVAYGPALGFGVNAVSYLSVIAVVFLIAPALTVRERDATSVLAATSIGIRYARFTPKFRNLLGVVAFFSVTSAVVQAILPVHTDHLGGSAGSFGLMLGLMGAGALVGAFVRPRLMASTTVNTVPYTISLFGLAGVGLGLAPNLWVAGVGMLLCGFFWLLTLSTLNATAQMMAPEWIRGRAMSMYNLAFAGMPLGSILAGRVADQIGTPGALVAFSVGSVLLGLVAPRFGVPRLDDIEAPMFSNGAPEPVHPETVLEGGPVIVLNTWHIDEGDYPGFARVMNQLRLVRLSTGAYRWRLMRDVSDPTRFTELFAVRSWEEHLAQHSRIDDASADLIRRAREFDRAGGPRNRHLVAVDVAEIADFEEMVATHAEMHRVDGSISLPDQET